MKRISNRHMTVIICCALTSLNLFNLLAHQNKDTDITPLLSPPGEHHLAHPTENHAYPNSLSVTSAQPTRSDFKVPNIVHYVWYLDKRVKFRFDKVLSILSAVKFIKPEAVYFHTNMEPYGEHFDMVKKIKNFKVVHRDPPMGNVSSFQRTDNSNLDRVKIILEKGGIYLDFDVMVLRSFDDLRRHACTVGYESSTKMCAGAIVCSKNHTFLYLWLNSFYDDRQMVWAYNTGTVPSKLIERYPELVHVDKDKIHRPHWSELDMIWGETPYPWRQNYAIHTWIRRAIRNKFTTFPTPESIKTMNSTYGQIARYVYFGTPDIVHT